MSAGGATNSPPNPGQKRPTSAGRPPVRLGPRILLGALALGLVYAMFPARPPKPPGSPPSDFKTPGVQNVENAYANGGATATHTKGYGGTIQGTKGSGPMRENAATDKPPGFDHDGIGEQQRPTQPRKIGEAFNELKYGSPRGK